MPKYAVFENDDCWTFFDFVDATSPVEACIKVFADVHMLHPGTRDYEIVDPAQRQGAAYRVLEVASETIVDVTEGPKSVSLRSSDPTVRKHYREYLARRGKLTAEDPAPDPAPVMDLDKVDVRLSVLKAAADAADPAGTSREWGTYDLLNEFKNRLRAAETMIATGYATARNFKERETCRRVVARMMENTAP